MWCGCVYTYVYDCMYTHVYDYMYTYEYGCMYAYVYDYMYTCVYDYMYAWTYLGYDLELLPHKHAVVWLWEECVILAQCICLGFRG